MESIPAFNLLGMIINPLEHEQILEEMDRWITERKCGRTVVFANTHVVMESRENSDLENATHAASLRVPDGMPLVIIARMRGFPLKSRADGPGLMAKVLGSEPNKQWRQYYYGGTTTVLDELKKRYPNTVIAGSYAPPFRTLTMEENEHIIDEINAVQPDILWVGLGCPKQEIWMYEHSKQLNVPVILGVGQAFDLLAGVKPRAPLWMQKSGFEWLFRLLKEPRRLLKRYLLYNPWFVWLALQEQIKYQLSK